MHDGYTLVADCFSGAYSEENAGLMALAPEMYETLKDIASVMFETSGIVGWHMNGRVAGWDEFECFQKITELLERIDRKESK